MEFTTQTEPITESLPDSPSRDNEDFQDNHENENINIKII